MRRAALALVFAAAMAGGWHAGVASAKPRLRDSERLAITWIAEAGWDATRDYHAMGHVFMRIRSRMGWSWRRVLSEYSRGTWHGSRRRAQWLRQLAPKCRRPKAWPHSAELWGVYKPKCEAVFASARSFLAKTPPDPCSGWAAHFGSEQDKPSPKLERIDCGDTKQVYYRRRDSGK